MRWQRATRAGDIIVTRAVALDGGSPPRVRAQGARRLMGAVSGDHLVLLKLALTIIGVIVGAYAMQKPRSALQRGH